jgi:hypothetical protein
MRKSGFSEAQDVGVLPAQESGSIAVKICGRHGVSEQTF